MSTLLSDIDNPSRLASGRSEARGQRMPHRRRRRNVDKAGRGGETQQHQLTPPPVNYFGSRLPPEIIEMIVAYLKKDDLQAARLVSWTWAAIASKYLFYSVEMSPDCRQFEWVWIKNVEFCRFPTMRRWNFLTAQNTLRHLPREATVYAAPVFYSGDEVQFANSARRYYAMSEYDTEDEETDFDRRLESDYGRKFHKEIRKITGLTQLRSVCLHFPPKRQDPYGFGCTPDKFTTTCDKILASLFKGLYRRLISRAEHSTVRTLKIVNLPNSRLDVPTISLAYEKILQEIEHLTLFFRVPGIGREGTCFTSGDGSLAYLQNSWLLPVAERLKTLTLGRSCERWGLQSGIFSDPELVFPCLEKLTLYRFCLTCDDGLDWVLRQSMLKSLRLHTCSILAWIQCYARGLEAMQPSTLAWEHVPLHGQDGRWFLFRYSRTWEWVLDRICDSLPCLSDFRFDGGSFENDCSSESKDMHAMSWKLPTELPDRRYQTVEFPCGGWSTTTAEGWVQTPVLSADSLHDPAPQWKRHEETWTGDSRAYNDLMRVVNKRREQEYVSL